MKAFRKFIRWWRSPGMHEMEGGLFAWDDPEDVATAPKMNGGRT